MCTIVNRFTRTSNRFSRYQINVVALFPSDGRLVKLFLFSTLLDKSPLTSIYFTTFEKKREVRSLLPTQPNFLVFGKYTYIYTWCICLNLCSVKRKFQRPISQLIKKIFTWNFEGGLIDHQSCFTQNLKFLAVREPAFLKSKFCQNRPLTGF